MQELFLERVPRQEFSVRLDMRRYQIRVIDVGGDMAVTITRDDVLLMSNVRAVAGFQLLPYQYMADGNFAFATESDARPWWEDFGNTCRLIYASASELPT